MLSKRLVIALVLAFVLCLALAGAALAMSSANYSLPWKVLSSGGEAVTSSNYRLVSTTGQMATGVLQNSGYRLESGFWAGSVGGEVPPPLAGDATGDSVIDAVDITKVERIIAGLDVQTPGADANSDDNVNAMDITKVERLIAELD